MTIQRKRKIQDILNMSKPMNTKEISDKKGNIDFKKLREHPITKEQIKQLKELKVSMDELREKGFLGAAMVLGRYLK